MNFYSLSDVSGTNYKQSIRLMRIFFVEPMNIKWVYQHATECEKNQSGQLRRIIY